MKCGCNDRVNVCRRIIEVVDMDRDVKMYVIRSTDLLKNFNEKQSDLLTPTTEIFNLF